MYSTKYIAQSFVKQYYEILSAKPNELYKFYFSQASFLHTEATVVEDSVIGVEAIRNKVKGLNLLGAKIDISKGFVDFQEFDVNRVLVVVVGVFTAAGQSPRQFTQTFVLAGQDNNYFVSNSVFRVLAEEVAKVEVVPVLPVQPSPAVEVEVVVVSTPEPEVAVEEPEVEEVVQEVVEEVQEVVEEVSAVEVAAAVEEEVASAVPVVPEEVAEVAVAVSPVSEEVTAEEVEEVEASSGAPKSYLDIVKKNAAKAAAVTTNNGFRTFKSKPVVASPQPTAATSPAPALTNIPTPSESTTVPPAVSTVGFKYTHNFHDISKVTGQQLFSVYVSNLPDTITEAQLALAFTPFGTVAQVDITRGKKYAFVKFEQIVAMQSALDHTVPIEVNGAILRVEERTKSTTIGTGTGTGGVVGTVGKDKKPYRKFVNNNNNNNKDNNNNNNKEYKDYKHKNNNTYNNGNGNNNGNKDNYKKETKGNEVETSK